MGSRTWATGRVRLLRTDGAAGNSVTAVWYSWRTSTRGRRPPTTSCCGGPATRTASACVSTGRAAARSPGASATRGLGLVAGRDGQGPAAPYPSVRRRPAGARPRRGAAHDRDRPARTTPGSGWSIWTGAGALWRPTTAPATSCGAATGCRTATGRYGRAGRPTMSVLPSSERDDFPPAWPAGNARRRRPV